MLDKVSVYSLTRNVEVTKEVCKKLGLEMGQCEVKHFADGEIMVDSATTVRGKYCYIIQSTCNPVTESLMELLVFVDGLRRASAKEITCIIPYFGYARQDRIAAPREPITARLVADLLRTAGADRVVCFDLHAPQIQGFFSFPVDNLTAGNMLGRYFKGILSKEIENGDVVVVSPDHGGVVRARNLAEMLNSTIAIFDKRRPKPNVAEIANVIGDVKGKTAIIIDDMIDTGGTIVGAANKLIELGATKVYACCTHAVFSKNALERLEESPIEKVITTDTIPLTRESDKVVVLSIADTLAKLIELFANGESISELFK